MSLKNILLSVVLLTCSIAINAQSTERVLVLPNLHVDEASFAKQETWPTVAVADLTRSLGELNTSSPNGIIMGTFNAGQLTDGTQGAVLFSMSEDYAMIEDGEFKDKNPQSEQGEVRSMIVIGVGKIPQIILDLLNQPSDPGKPAPFYALHTADDARFNILKSVADNDQGFYVLVVDNKKVIHFFKDEENYSKYLDGLWHNFAVYSFQPGGAWNSGQPEDALSVVVDSNVLNMHANGFVDQTTSNVFFNISRDLSQGNNRSLTHAMLGGCMIRGRCVMPTKSNLMLDNIGIFAGGSAINELIGDEDGPMIDRIVGNSYDLVPGMSEFSFAPTPGLFLMDFNEQDTRWITIPTETAPMEIGSILNGSKILWADIDPTVTDTRAYAVDCSAIEPVGPSGHLKSTLLKLRCPDRYPNYVMVVAHRGYHRDVPEHSMPSIEYVPDLIENGVDMVELDVRFTKDDTAVLTHDMFLDRLSTGTGSIEEKTWDEIKDLKLKNYDGTETTYGFVRLFQALEKLKGKIHILLDIKTTGDLRQARLKHCLKLAKSWHMLDQMAAGGGSFSINEMKAAYPEYFGKFLFIPSADASDINRRDVQKFLREFFLSNNAPLVGIRYKTAKDVSLTPFNYVDFVKDYKVRPIIFARWPDFLEGNNRDGRDVIDVDPLTDERGNFDFIVRHGATIITTDRPLLLIDYLKAIGKH